MKAIYMNKETKRNISMPNRRSGFVINFIVRAILGLGIIFFTNEYLAYREISLAVGMNGISFLTSGFFGLPGVCLLYGILIYQNL